MAKFKVVGIGHDGQRQDWSKPVGFGKAFLLFWLACIHWDCTPGVKERVNRVWIIRVKE